MTHKGRAPRLEQETIRADMLVIGGGLAGCMAAIRAGEIVGPDNVLVVDKANIRRSGNAATGVDHTWSYMPEVHGPMGYTVEQLVEDHVKSLGPLQDQDVIYSIASTVADRIKTMESWGFPMKTNGVYDYVQKIHRVPTFLHWAGRNQKVLFRKELERRGIHVLNRVIVTDLITQEGEVTGAIGAGIRDPKMYLFHAKAVIVTTGGISRLFPGINSCDFNRQRYPFGTGDGVAMAYRAGAELTRMEYITRWTGPKNFVKPGRGTWIGIVEDFTGQPVGRVKPVADRKKIDLSVESPHEMMTAYREGRAPLFINCIGISDEDWAYMNWGLSNEGNMVLLNHMKDSGVDPRQERVEFTFYEPEVTGGIVAGPSGETNLPGLFAAGGEVIGNIKRAVSAGAFALGWLAGEKAGAYARNRDFGDDERGSQGLLDGRRDLWSRILDRQEGASWQEVTSACQDLMAYYAGETRYESLLKAGLCRLQRLREEALRTMRAANQHELMRCLEALNLMDVGEAVILTATERKESRYSRWDAFARVDYPQEGKDMDRLLIVRLEQGRPVLLWREPRRMHTEGR